MLPAAVDVASAAGSDVSDDGAPLGVKAAAGVPGVEQVSVTRQWGGDATTLAAVDASGDVRAITVRRESD